MTERKFERPQVTIIAVGGGGLNIALDLIDAKIFKSYNLIAFDSDSSYYEEIESKRKNKALFFSSTPAYDEFLSSTNDLNYYSEDLLDWEERADGISKIIVLCTTLGGKIGSSIAPLIGLAASLQGRFVFSIFSLPSKFEGEQRMARALEASKKLIDVSNISIEQRNDSLSWFSDLKMNEIHVPLIEVFQRIFKQSIYRLAEGGKDVLEIFSIVPEKYRNPDFVLINTYTNSYRSTPVGYKIKNFTNN